MRGGGGGGGGLEGLAGLKYYMRVPGVIGLSYLSLNDTLSLNGNGNNTPTTNTNTNTNTNTKCIVTFTKSTTTISCLHASKILPFSHITLQLSHTLITNWLIEILNYNSVNLTNETELIEDVARCSWGKRGRYALPLVKGEMGNWEGYDDENEDENVGEEKEKEKEDGAVVEQVKEISEDMDVVMKEEEGAGESKKSATKSNTKSNAKKSEKKKKKGKNADEDEDDDSDSGSDDGSDNGSDSDESITTKRTRLIAERDARLAAEKLNATRQYLDLSVLGPVLGKVLFNPSYLGLTEMNVGECVGVSIGRCDESIRAALYNNIVVYGELSEYNGVIEGIEEIVVAEADEIYEVTVMRGEGGDKAVVEGIREALVGSFSNNVKEGIVKLKEGGVGDLNEEALRRWDDVCNEDNEWYENRFCDNSYSGIRDVFYKDDDFEDVLGGAGAGGNYNGYGDGDEGTNGVGIEGRISPAMSAATEDDAALAVAAAASKKRKYTKKETSTTTAAAKKAPAKPRAPKKEKKEQEVFTVGQLVEARFDRKAIWYRGVVVHVHNGNDGNAEGGEGGGTGGEGLLYDVSYEDADFDSKLEPRFVRARRVKAKK
jgi:hypothetical protein